LRSVFATAIWSRVFQPAHRAMARSSSGCRLPDRIEQDAGACDVAARVPDCPGAGSRFSSAWRAHGGIKRQEDSADSELLEVDSEIVLRIGVEPPEMRAR